MVGYALVCLPCSILYLACWLFFLPLNAFGGLSAWGFISMGTSLSLTPNLDTKHDLVWAVKGCRVLLSVWVGEADTWEGKVALGCAQCISSGTCRGEHPAASGLREHRPAPWYREDPRNLWTHRLTLSLAGNVLYTDSVPSNLPECGFFCFYFYFYFFASSRQPPGDSYEI